jgi:hypothetical protein
MEAEPYLNCVVDIFAFPPAVIARAVSDESVNVVELFVPSPDRSMTV